ncbi:hypothetical protein B9Z19DRAFT_1120510 [Tuber borchii]|uniref:Uncharacterized protein n=1 Tax=Tuber borchii TaxID=42251 RepID=A0A2T7A4I5_TUBBO|nr:hypothetical protein B9Z19DRAFT_1120510 [Tuber borchii]
MQAKVFLSYLLATILAVGVIATPVDVLDSVVTPPPDTTNVFEQSFEALATFTATPDPTPTGPTITPGEFDLPIPTGNASVVARDLKTLEKRKKGCIFVTTGCKFKGVSAYICKLPYNKCVNWNTYWSVNLSSFRPDPGIITLSKDSSDDLY